MKKQLIVTCTLASIIAFACTSKQNNKPDFLASNIDSAIKPEDDFFEYANGRWIKNNPIPDEESSWGIGNLVIEENNKRLKEISEKAATANAAKGTAEQKVGDFWYTAMDSITIEKQGTQALQPYFAKIDAATDFTSLTNVMIDLEKIGVGNWLTWYIGQDEKNSELIALKFWQGGISLPEKEFYFKTDSVSVKQRKGLVDYYTKLLTLSGWDAATATKEAAAILAMETSIAKVHRSRAEVRDPIKNYNKLAAKDFNALLPSFNLGNYFAALGLKNVDSVVVGQPEYYKAIQTILPKTSLSTLKTCLRLNVLKEYSGSLPNAYGIAGFEYNKLFSGAKQRKPRWKRVIRAEENVMGELLGQLFAKEYFNATAKKRYEDMVEAIRTAYKERLEKLDWMSDTTKKKAFAKLASMKRKVGYPDKWKDFSALDLRRDGYANNMIRANEFWVNYNLNKYGKPVNRDEWEMYPQTDNAYYNPSNNEIVLPAGQLTVPGFRDEELDDALVYGYSAASTIGHEITHGFDDEGRQFDDKGNLVSWWTQQDEQKFNQKANFIAKQFNEFNPIDTLHIKGEVTMGENIADLGGVLLGWDAFIKTKQYKEGKLIAGLTPAQRFFLGYSLGWLGHTRPENLRNELLTDVHSPGKYRVNGPFVNVPAFYEAFNIKPGTKMYRADSLRVKIW